MITLHPDNIACNNAAEVMAALKANKEAPAVVALIGSDGEMLALNSVITKEAALLTSAALRFDKPTELWKIGSIYSIDENRWKLLIVRQAITADQIAQSKAAQAMQQMAMAATGGGMPVLPDVLQRNPGRRRG